MIKFRIYSKLHKKFYKDGETTYLITMEGSLAKESYDSGIGWFTDQDDHIVQQWTGLQDKNGLDIYEGDIIVDWKECLVLTIKKNDAPVQFLGEDFYLDETMKEPYIFSFALHNEPSRYEVFGTIFGLKEKPCKPDHNGECLICDCWLSECHLHEHLRIPNETTYTL